MATALQTTLLSVAFNVHCIADYTLFWNFDFLFYCRLRTERLDMLGPDLAAAHFIVFREGRVKFHGHTDWVFSNEDDEYDLPVFKTEGFLLQEVDFSNMRVHYEGLENLSE